MTAASTSSRGAENAGGDSGAWVGELQFLDWYWEREQGRSKVGDKTLVTRGTPKKGLGVKTLYTIVGSEDCVVWAWSHEDMKDLMQGSTDLRAALTRAMTSALVGKVVNLTVSRTKREGGRGSWVSWLSDWDSEPKMYRVNDRKTDSRFVAQKRGRGMEPPRPLIDTGAPQAT